MNDANPKDNSKFATNLAYMFNTSKLFTGIDRAACEALLPRLTRISLNQGEILFNQGDASDCLYLLIEGELMAFLLMPDGKQKLVGTIDRGETAGELGALSNQTRTLTIRAGTNCELLKISQEIFKEFSIQNPAFINNTIDLITKRNQNTLKIASQKKPYQHIAIIQECDNDTFNKFIKKIEANFIANEDFNLSLERQKGLLINHCIDQAEINNKSLIFILNPKNAAEMENRINHIGGVYVVVDGDKQESLSVFATTILKRHITPFGTQYELVLLHDDNIELPKKTSLWLKQADFTLHHHLRVNNDLDHQRLLRFMMGRAIGLVLGGGGIKGWTILGVLRALLEANVPIDIIGGTSVGALIASSYAYSLSYSRTVQIFERLVECTSDYVSLKSITWPLVSLFNGGAPTNVLQEIFGEVVNEDLWITNFIMASNLSTGSEAILSYGVLWRSLRASAALPVIVPPVVIGSELYVDGGLLNNLPIDVMRQIIGNESLIIGVSLTARDGFNRNYNFPPILPFRIWLLRKFKLRYDEYEFPPFINTILEAMLLGSSTKENANQLLADILINPDLSHFGIKISTKNSDVMMNIGYQMMQEKISFINHYINFMHSFLDKKTNHALFNK